MWHILNLTFSRLSESVKCHRTFFIRMPSPSSAYIGRWFVPVSSLCCRSRQGWRGRTLVVSFLVEHPNSTGKSDSRRAHVCMIHTHTRYAFTIAQICLIPPSVCVSIDDWRIVCIRRLDLDCCLAISSFRSIGNGLRTAAHDNELGR